MEDYKSMYYKLFNRVSDVIEYLQKSQQESELAYLDLDDDASGQDRDKQAGS